MDTVTDICSPAAIDVKASTETETIIEQRIHADDEQTTPRIPQDISVSIATAQAIDDSSSPDPSTSVVQSFYTDAQTYWDTVPSTVDGMLGGFAPINAADIRGSLAYLQSMYRLKPAPKRRYALDCGAGIGRVTKHLLLPLYEQVDAVEQNARFAAELRGYVGASPKLGQVFNQGLQEFAPEAGKYDLIWSQWVLGHLTDSDLVAFFRRCILGLAKNGLMIIKENVTSSERSEIDEVDSSLTRPLADLKRLLALSGMRIVRCTVQTNFPAGIYPVYMITVRPQ